ncbi:HTH_Tnp_Tc3_2 domain-containing protein [Trichonephila clavipes]|nr:HTH_Tnp_Tc3_2 domain-containing protein [Trichonephila clavipes]
MRNSTRELNLIRSAKCQEVVVAELRGIQEGDLAETNRQENNLTRSTIREDLGVAIVPQTNSRHLAEANLKSKRPFRALPLTPQHRQLRLQWCQARSMWNVTDWQNAVFSDESRFVLGTDDNRVRVWRHPDSSMADLSPVEHVWDQLKRQMPSSHSVHDLDCSRAFDDGPRNFEPWPRDEDDTSVGNTSPNFYIAPMEGGLSSRQI